MRITGLLSTVSGRNGSAARVSRQPNSSDSTNEAPISIRIGGDSPRQRVPPQVSASSSGMAEPIISAGAEHVELVAAVVARDALEIDVGEQRRAEAERHVDPEDQRPVQMLGDARRRTPGRTTPDVTHTTPM